MSEDTQRPGFLRRLFRIMFRTIGVFVVVIIALAFILPEPEKGVATSEPDNTEVSAQAEAEPEEPEEPVEPVEPRILRANSDLTLAGYRDMRKSRRDDLLRAYFEREGAPFEDLDLFRACMGDFAVTKSPDLAAADVFGWCENERVNIPDRFASHFNELDARKVEVEALLKCQDHVRANLVSPASADFPFLGHTTISKGRQRYAVRSYVDSQNGFGAVVRTWWLCDIQFAGGDLDAYDIANWTLHELTFDGS